MESPYFLFGLLIMITGFFLAIALSIQFCACAKAFRRIQKEKERLREIQEAAAQPPPPYAVVVASCSRHFSNQCVHSQSQIHGGGNMCIIKTINPQHGHVVSNFVPVTNAANTVCCSCSRKHVGVGVEEALNCNEYQKQADIELPPNYEEALKIENATSTGAT